MNLVDTHAHLDFTQDKTGWCQRAKEAGVNKIICVGTSVEASLRCVEIAEKYSSEDLQIYATVGIHAQDGQKDMQKYGSLERCIDELKQIFRSAQDDKTVVGVGECGYDFKIENRVKRTEFSDKEREFQKELFKAQIELAAELNLPMVIHCRNAWEETFELIDSIAKQVSLQNDREESFRGVFHSWTGDWEAAKRALEMGFHISFSGIVTFKNAPEVQEVAKKIPLERMLLETDSPFLAPHPLRGSPNEPKNVKIIAEFITQLRNFPVDQVARVTSENAGRLFGIE